VSASWRADVVILTCAISAGIHGALAPEHFEEGTGAGLGFVAATVLLAAFAIWLTLRPDDRRGLAGAAIVLVGLIASYALAVTTGLPLLHPEAEPIEGLALVTKAIEAAGVAAASTLLRHRSAFAFAHPQPRGT
jgi:drug/metabolite transporter (DMT)-like permease